MKKNTHCYVGTGYVGVYLAVLLTQLQSLFSRHFLGKSEAYINSQQFLNEDEHIENVQLRRNEM